MQDNIKTGTKNGESGLTRDELIIIRKERLLDSWLKSSFFQFIVKHKTKDFLLIFIESFLKLLEYPK